MYRSTQQFDLQISFRTASLLRVAQVAGIGFLFVTITLVSYIGMPTEKSNSIAGLLNFMRNIGSSIGTSMVTTLIARRSQVHQAYLVTHVTAGRPPFTQAVAALAKHLTASGLESSLLFPQPSGGTYPTPLPPA